MGCCCTNPNLCPAPGDSENNLLTKILQSINAGGGVAGVSSISVNGGAPQTGAVSISTGGTVTSVNGDPGPAVSLDSGEIPEGANLYFTNARAIASTLTGFVAGAGTVTAADSVLTALQKSAGTTNDLLNFRDSNAHADASIFINSGATEIIKVVGATAFIRLNTTRIHRDVDNSQIAFIGGIGKTTASFLEVNGDTAAAPGFVLLTTKGQTAGAGSFRILNAPLASAASVLRAQMTWEGDWSLTPTWNDAADAFVAFDVNPTNTASAAGALLGRFRASSVSQWEVSKAGATTQVGTITTTQYSADTVAARMFFRKSRSATVGTDTIVVRGDLLGQIRYTGYDGANYLQMGSIDVGTEGTIAATRVPTYFAVSTATDATPSVLTPRMRITSAGLVGFGPSTTPGANLDINNGTTTTFARIYHTTDGLASPANFSRITLSHNAAATGRQTANFAAETGGTGAADIDIRLRPVGLGGLYLGPVADGATTGGNARGAASVDLQITRVAAAQVASGVSSFAAGLNNTASAEAAFAIGNFGVANKYGQFTQGGYGFAVAGDAQTSVLTMIRQTTDATANVEMFLTSAALRCTIATDTTWVFCIYLVARRTNADNESAGYKFEGVIDNNAGTTALVGTVTKTVLAEDTAAWDADVVADDANDSLKIQVTGEAAKTINWVARITLVETTG